MHLINLTQSYWGTIASKIYYLSFIKYYIEHTPWSFLMTQSKRRNSDIVTYFSKFAETLSELKFSCLTKWNNLDHLP